MNAQQHQETRGYNQQSLDQALLVPVKPLAGDKIKETADGR